MVMLPVDTMYLTLLVLFMLPRERLRLNQRLMLMLSTAPMDMVLDPSMEDTPPTPDLLSPAMLLLLSLPLLTPDPLDTPPTPDLLSPAMPDQLFHPLDTLPTLDQSMEDTP